MKEAYIEKLTRIQELAFSDAEYMALWEEYGFLNQEILALIDRLSVRERELLMNYIGVYGGMWMRMLEIACATMDFES